MSCPCHECHATQLAAILQDLIAELRGDTGICDDVGVKEYTDRAEARLKEVQGE